MSAQTTRLMLSVNPLVVSQGLISVVSYDLICRPHCSQPSCLGGTDPWNPGLPSCFHASPHENHEILHDRNQSFGHVQVDPGWGSLGLFLDFDSAFGLGCPPGWVHSRLQQLHFDLHRFACLLRQHTLFHIPHFSPQELLQKSIGQRILLEHLRRSNGSTKHTILQHPSGLGKGSRKDNGQRVERAR